MQAFNMTLTECKIWPDPEPKIDFYHFSYGLVLGIPISYSDRSDEHTGS